MPGNNLPGSWISWWRIWDDGAMYFQMLAHDFKQMELQRLKKEAQKIPPKIRVFSFVMLMCFLATYLVIIVMEIIKSMGTMF